MSQITVKKKENTDTNFLNFKNSPTFKPIKIENQIEDKFLLHNSEEDKWEDILLREENIKQQTSSLPQSKIENSSSEENEIYLAIIQTLPFPPRSPSPSSSQSSVCSSPETTAQNPPQDFCNITKSRKSSASRSIKKVPKSLRCITPPGFWSLNVDAPQPTSEEIVEMANFEALGRQRTLEAWKNIQARKNSVPKGSRVYGTHIAN
ncbi:hypothetical protein G9A89_007151 [Geosiphon pyriformis]|nr:hypothetical protein G9A89_007151 [Geosiphon pyriformis]